MPPGHATNPFLRLSLTPDEQAESQYRCPRHKETSGLKSLRRRALTRSGVVSVCPIRSLFVLFVIGCYKDLPLLIRKRLKKRHVGLHSVSCCKACTLPQLR